MLWLVFWKVEKESFSGIVKANTRIGAIQIAERKLRRDAIVTGCVETEIHKITPQSLTLNFKNNSDYDTAWNHPEAGVNTCA